MLNDEERAKITASMWRGRTQIGISIAGLVLSLTAACTTFIHIAYNHFKLGDSTPILWVLCALGAVGCVIGLAKGIRDTIIAAIEAYDTVKDGSPPEAKG